MRSHWRRMHWERGEALCPPWCTMCGTDALQRESVSNAFIDDAAQPLRHGDPGVARGQWRQAGQLLRDFASAGEEHVGRHDFVHRAPLFGGFGIELLPRQDEIAAAYGADRFLPNQMDTIPRRDP